MAKNAKKAQQKAKKEQKRKKRVQAAKKQERQLLQSGSTASLEAKIDKALDQLQKGNIDQAEEMLAKLEAKHSDNAYLHFAFAVVASNNKDNVAAIESFEKALEIDESFVEAYVNLARIYTEEVDVKRSVENLEKVVALKDKDPALAADAEEYLKQINEHCLKEDSLTMEEVIKAQDLFEEGLDQIELGKMDGAVKALESSIKIKENSAYVFSNLAFAYAASGQKAEALKALEQALELDKDEDFAKSLKEPIENLEDGETLSFEKL